MKYNRYIIVLSAILALGALKAEAADVGMVRVASDSQVQAATSVLGHALWVDVDGFVVMADAAQQLQLERAGIPFRVLMENVSRSRIWIVRPADHRTFGRIDLSQLGRIAEVSPGLTLVQMSPTLATSVAKTSGLWVNNLEDHSFPFFFVPPAVANTAANTAYYPTDTLTDLVSVDSIYAMTLRLQNFVTRYTYSDSILAARDWLVEKFHSWGYTDVTTPEFDYSGPIYNVVAVKPGYAEPDKLIVVGGHYDAIIYESGASPMYMAPGADDNASGTTLVLELARILASVPLRKTVVFIAFSAEEQGLVGSYRAAEAYKNSGTDIDVMFNYDMIGHDPANGWGLNMSSGGQDIFRQVSAEAAARTTPLKTNQVAIARNSDHFSFYQNGFSIVNNIEADFNSEVYHTTRDATGGMNFPYMADVVKAALASVAQVALAASPPRIAGVIDHGDGQSLEVFVDSCRSDYAYVIAFGRDSGSFERVEIVPSGACSLTIDGLAEGETYYFSLFSTAIDGYPSLYANQVAETPMSVPRAPSMFSAASDTSSIVLSWAENTETDFAYYRVYRRIWGEPTFSVYRTGLVDTEFADDDVQGGITYYYRVTAVDDDGYESEQSTERPARLATFDQGILLVDETIPEARVNPSEPEQAAWCDSLFGEIPYALTRIDSSAYALRRVDAASYSSIFWFDLDRSEHWIPRSLDTLEWYLGFDHNNMLFSGSWTLYDWPGRFPILPFDLLYTEFRITAYAMNSMPDFVGAQGQNGWPSVQVDSNRVHEFYEGRLSVVPRLGHLDDADVIYTFDSFTDDMNFEGQPCAIAYDGPKGKRVFIGFPLSALTMESAQALVQYAAAYFGEIRENPIDGDVNNNGKVDLGDVTRLIDCLYLKGLPLADPNQGDVNGDCELNLQDVLYLIGYLYLDGEAPVAGCVE